MTGAEAGGAMAEYKSYLAANVLNDGKIVGSPIPDAALGAC